MIISLKLEYNKSFLHQHLHKLLLSHGRFLLLFTDSLYTLLELLLDLLCIGVFELFHSIKIAIFKY